MCGLWQHSWYSDSLQGGLSGDWIPACMRFSEAVQTNPRSHSIHWIPDFYSGIEWPGSGREHPHPSVARMKVCVCVCVCGGLIWIAHFEPRRFTVLSFTILTLLLSSLPVNHCACRGAVTHYKLDHLGIESWLAREILQLSRPALACMEEGRGVHKILVGKPEGKRPLGRPRPRWEDNIKMDLEEVGNGGGDWMELAQDRDRWPALVSTVMNFWVP